ncbi:MAG TPA: MobF family relaxase, partial [Acidimicrobiales bacterium]|nr:MobF family relaxase [Acidimicrobiales bacterium]
MALSIDEYYSGVGESPGVWAGRWAEGLGLAGVVEAEDLRALVEGRHPETGTTLLAGSRARSVLAFDLTFSAPKSVSLLWALGSEGAAEVVAAAHREAVEVALGFLEERAAVARVQSKGVRRRVGTSGWAVAGFVHRTSREGDPQLHTHCLVPNLVRRADGRHVAFDAGPLFEWARAAGSVYQNHLQRALVERLGVGWGPDRHNTRELEGFTRDQLRAFSKRTAQIEAELERRGATYESPGLRMRADDEASLMTRTGKDHSLTPRLLAGRWREEASEVGLAVGVELGRAVCATRLRSEAPGWDELVEVLVDPQSGLCSRSARFGRSDVVERICAVSGGRLSTGEIVGLVERFLESDLVVRLYPESGERARPAQWSTVAHRALEDRTLALMDTLAARPAPPIPAEAVGAVLAGVGLGEDQAAAVEMLAGDGGCLRAVLAPAGYGKTTMLHSAARAAAGAGRPVLAVATTAKAVAELSGAGLDARTIARLRIDLEDGPLRAGSVVVLDEISQTPTDQVEAVLAAVDACPGGQVWVLGDPRQSQPVGPGGIADHIETLAAAGTIRSARLTVNRRQVDPVDREALDLLRQGDAAGSQQLRAEQGWEHEYASPSECRRAMAGAVCDDIGRYGPDQVAALVVSHADAEDLADRIRGHLSGQGALSGPTLTGPGWAGERTYQAGDRVLLHARVGGAGSVLVNGTTATVVRVDEGGMAVRIDTSGAEAVLPAEFVAGTRKDGTPNLSHAWARTVDGAQGGTWQACHLLGSTALDAYRGYTGQSRSRHPTHTWNTARVGVVDHGGILADQRDPAEQVAGALARQPDPTLAARHDPWIVDRQIRERIAEHERVLADPPPKRQDQLAAAQAELEAIRAGLAEAEAAAARSAAALAGLGPLGGLSRHGREQRRRLEQHLEQQEQRAAATRCDYDLAAGRVERLLADQAAYQRFQTDHGWRQDDLDRLRGQLDDHWTSVVVACVAVDDPLAYGIDKLRHARVNLVAGLQALDDSVPKDRTQEWEQARQRLPEAVRQRHQTEQSLAEVEARLEDAQRRRWGRHDHRAIADAQAQLAALHQQAERAAAEERRLRDHLAELADHQRARQQHIADSAGRRGQRAETVAQLDDALDRTRLDRVRRLADDPPEHLVTRLGAPPGSAAGRAVWCHHALRIEADRDHDDG